MSAAIADGVRDFRQQKPQKVSSRKGKSSNPITAWVWRYYIWAAGTFSLGMMEIWEQLLVSFLFISLSGLIWWSVYFHFPNHIRSVLERGSYYIFGTSSNSTDRVLDSVRGALSNVTKHQEL